MTAMGRAILSLVVALCLLAAAIVWQAPATFMGARVEQLSGQRVALAAAQGTVWRGRGTLVAGATRMPLAWRVSPLSLLRGEVAVALVPPTDGSAAPTGELRVTAQGLHLDAVRITVPAAAVAAAAAARPSLDATGDVEIVAQAFDWPLAPTTSGILAATWRRARLGLTGSDRIDLGEVTVTLRAAGGNASGPLANTGGDLAIAGELLLQTQGGGHIRGTVRPRRDDDPRLEWLKAAGTPDGRGVRLEWQWQGR